MQYWYRLGNTLLGFVDELIEFFEDGRVELYNLREDVSEEDNIAKDKPDITQKLKEMLVDWREKVEAKIPEPNPDYKPW